MNTSSINPTNTPQSYSRLGAWRASIIANKKRHKKGLGGLWSFAVLAWAAMTTLQVMQYIAVSTPIPVETGDPMPVFPAMEALIIWLAFSLGGFVVALVRKKAFRRTLFSLRGLFPTLISLVVGAFLGGNIFTLSVLDHQAQSIVMNTAAYPSVSKKMMMYEYATSQEQAYWFDKNQMLRSELKEKWCANALPRVQTYADLVASPAQENIALNALLAQGLVGKVYVQGCMSDMELLAAQSKLHDAARGGSRQQTVMEKMGWAAPILTLAAQAAPQIVDRTLFSPKRACQVMGDNSMNEAKRLAICAQFPNNRPITPDELPKIRAVLVAAQNKAAP